MRPSDEIGRRGGLQFTVLAMPRAETVETIDRGVDALVAHRFQHPR
jgi:hypothetical protein